MFAKNKRKTNYKNISAKGSIHWVDRDIPQKENRKAESNGFRRSAIFGLQFKNKNSGNWVV